MKRKISILLAVIMVVGIMTPVTSFAEIVRTSDHKPYEHTKVEQNTETCFRAS